jgi:type IV conjugative transfer system lipoprotein TraV
MKLALIVTLTNFTTLISSCSKDWSCPAEKGFSCRSISQVDGNNSNTSKASKGSSSNNKKKSKINKNLLSNTLEKVIIDDLKPVRTQEKIGKVLITPYIDKEENLNSGKYIYTIDEKPEWRIVN